jgi:hypothetical protein
LGEGRRNAAQGGQQEREGFGETDHGGFEIRDSGWVGLKAKSRGHKHRDVVMPDFQNKEEPENAKFSAAFQDFRTLGGFSTVRATGRRLPG